MQVKVNTAESLDAAKLLEEMQRQRDALQAQLTELKKKTKSVSFQVSRFTNKKGEEQCNIVVHGITPKPLPLYGSQALAFVSIAEQLKEFVEANRAVLTWK